MSVYQAFNTVGKKQLGNPDGSFIPGHNVARGPLTMLFCGPSDRQADAAEAIDAVGFKPVFVGPIRYSRNLEAIAELWIHLAVQPGGFAHLPFGDEFHFQVAGKDV